MTTSSVDKSVSSQKALQEEEEVKSKLQSAEQQQVSWQHWGPISGGLSICILFIFWPKYLAICEFLWIVSS